VILASALLLAVSACGSGAKGDTAVNTAPAGVLSVVGAALDRPANPSLAALRLRISNQTAEPKVLVGASSPDGKASIHRSDVDEQGRSVMTRVDRLDVPARSSLVFEPGGLHVMIDDISRDLQVGDTVEVTLEFEGGESLRFVAPVVDPLSGSEHDHEALAPTAEPIPAESGAT
jgi:copper(I)-binding protein